jgi:hypothetical protein
MGLDRNSALALKVHGIEQLVLLLALVNRAGTLKQSIRQRRLAMIDVRNDAEVASKLDSHEGRTMRVRGEAVNDRTRNLPLPLDPNLRSRPSEQIKIKK